MSGGALRKNTSQRIVWTTEQTRMLLDLWEEKIEELRGSRKNSFVHQEMAAAMQNAGFNGTWTDVRTKLDNLTRKYKIEKNKIDSTGGAPSNWEYYSKVHNILGPFKFHNIELSMHESTEMPVRSKISSDEDDIGFINVKRKYASKKSSKAKARIDFLKKATEHYESSSKIARVEDEAAVYANGWACMYRRMNPNQQLFAKRAIDEILMLGRLDQLTFDTVQCSSNGFINSPPAISRASTTYSSSTTAIGLSDDSVQFAPSAVYPNGSQQNY